MNIRNLHHLLNPRSIDVIAALSKRHTIGATVLANSLDGGFARPIWPGNPQYGSLARSEANVSVANLPMAPDLAIVGTPPATVPDLISQLGACGCKSTIIMSAVTCYPTEYGLQGRQVLGGSSLARAGRISNVRGCSDLRL